MHLPAFALRSTDNLSCVGFGPPEVQGPSPCQATARRWGYQGEDPHKECVSISASVTAVTVIIIILAIYGVLRATHGAADLLFWIEKLRLKENE